MSAPKRPWFGSLAVHYPAPMERTWQKTMCGKAHKLELRMTTKADEVTCGSCRIAMEKTS